MESIRHAPQSPSDTLEQLIELAECRATALDALSSALNGTAPQAPLLEQPDPRTLNALRSRVDELLRAGFDVVGRNPLRLTRGRQAYVVENKVLKSD